MRFEEYLSSLHSKTVAVIGIGVSNRPLIELLLSRGVAVTACDKKDRAALGPLAAELEGKGCRLRLGPDYLKDLTEDVIFRTPGMRPDLPELTAAVERGSALTSEMEVFFAVCPCPIIAVTGSDGKTTTTTIIAELLRAAGHTVHLGGNIGHPLLAETGGMTAEDVAVLELSSFQLMTMTRSPHIAVVTNLSPNHLDVHKDYDEYIAAKGNIFTHQTPKDIAVFNADNEVTSSFIGRELGGLRTFSRRKTVERGAYLAPDTSGDGQAVWVSNDTGRRRVLPLAEIKLPGAHNVENYLAAIAAVNIQADLLVLMSDIEGLYTADPRKDPDARLIGEVHELTEEVLALADGAGSELGTGGMVTKLRAASMCMAAGCDMIITNGQRPEDLYRIAAGESVGTRFFGKTTGGDTL